MERLLQEIIDILPVGIWVSDANGQLLRANPAALRICRGNGRANDADGPAFAAWWGECIRTFPTSEWGTHQALASGRTSFGHSIAVACFDGSIKTLLHASAPLHDEQGRITGAVAVIEDISELTRSQAHWRRREQLLHTMIDLLPVGVWAADGRGRVTLVNPAADRIWSGHDWSSEVDCADFRGWWADSGEPVAAEDWAVARAMRDGASTRGDPTHIETPDGSRRTIISWAAPLRDEAGDVSGAVAVTEDITALYRVQEQLRAAVADREHILAVVAHDLRNPLSSIMIAASTAGDMAAQLPGAEHVGARLDAVLDLARQMAGMVDDLLSIAISNGSGKTMLSLRQVPPADLIERACAQARPLFAKRGIALHCQVEPGLPPVCADAKRIQRVLANVLDNALKYTKPPCEVHVLAEARGPVVFSIANEGPPLADDVRESMFQPFWQAGRHHRGAGLGLSICRSIVEAHGGSIWTEEARGQRVRVCFSLPHTVSANAAPAAHHDAARDGRAASDAFPERRKVRRPMSDEWGNAPHR
ncbi:MAG: ATP-binding protein [Luteimonas sp.]